MKTEIKSNIAAIRDIEDCIRITKKYTKGVFRKKEQYPIQGEEFASKVLIEYYEVYPYIDLDEKMSLLKAYQKTWAWIWGDEKHIDVFFRYDYRDNKASVKIHDGHKAVEELKKNIPGFKESLDNAININKERLVES